MIKVLISTTDMLKTRWIFVELALKYRRIKLTTYDTKVQMEVLLEDPVLNVITKRLITENLMQEVSFFCGDKKMRKIKPPTAKITKIMELFQNSSEWTNQELIKTLQIEKCYLSRILHELEKEGLITKKDRNTWCANLLEEKTSVEEGKWCKIVGLISTDSQKEIMSHLIRYRKISEECLNEKFGGERGFIDRLIKEECLAVIEKETYQLSAIPQELDLNRTERKLLEEIMKAKEISKVKSRIPHSKWKELEQFANKLEMIGSLTKKVERTYYIYEEDRIIYFLAYHPGSCKQNVKKSLLMKEGEIAEILCSMKEKGWVKVGKCQSYSLNL